MKEFVGNNCISILALLVSIVSLCISIYREIKSAIDIKVEPCLGECVYLTRLDSLICYGVIVCRIRITNKSDSSCGINKIELKLGKEVYEALPFKEIVVTNSEDIKFNDVNTKLPYFMRLSSENIFTNPQLQPYETKKVYVTFPASIAIPKEIIHGKEKANIKIMIVNKRFSSRVRVQLLSRKLNQEWK